MTYADAAELLGVSRQAVAKRAGPKAEGWAKLSDQSELARRAYDRADEAEAAEAKRRAAAPDACPPGGGDMLPDEGPVASVVTELTAVELRAKVLQRHRTEWNGVRKIAYDAIRGANPEKARVADTTASAITKIQQGERKAYGLDEKEEPGAAGPLKVVIERK
jgi:hypothetical protein